MILGTYECKTCLIWESSKASHKLPQIHLENVVFFQRDCFAGRHRGWTELMRMHLTKRHIFGATLCLRHVLLVPLFYRCRIVCLTVGAACRATGTLRHIRAQAGGKFQGKQIAEQLFMQCLVLAFFADSLQT